MGFCPNFICRSVIDVEGSAAVLCAMRVGAASGSPVQACFSLHGLLGQIGRAKRLESLNLMHALKPSPAARQFRKIFTPCRR